MKQFPKKLQSKLNQRKENNSFRELNSIASNLIDFTSNDYLGFSKSKSIFTNTHQYLTEHELLQNGATGSRLLNGNHYLYTLVEEALCEFHESETALIFNSGYDANLGLLSCIPQKDDFIFYDEYSHASIRDGISLSNAKSYKFKHNDLTDLQEKLLRLTKTNIKSEVYIVTESVFSMDGDSPNLIQFCDFCTQYNYHLIIDEAHTLGVFGNGKGLIQELGIQDQIFARLVTFGKALGCHGSAVLGSRNLKEYLINFARSFIYTTALPLHTLATIESAYNELKNTDAIKKLHYNIQFFKSEIKHKNLSTYFINSDSAIQSCIIPKNKLVKSISNKLKESGFNVKPILSPTVSKGEERLRFCIHSYNSKEEITKVLSFLATFVAA
ncbi:aminotransferase class I/II-fold pyridoxal phosphate-dependent enzyme [Flavobacteriaceae bacterium AU392]|nr:pyridoxal phosphate-dependent aminotransferase family protein [Flavobacteriaceae bacterium]RKM84670.1 aminotransferase class I/II-fold pyridoxal phosphate-dependent enzyme [Flavobacteriaceae bacterium AU392]